jgi:hypothetical protein
LYELNVLKDHTITALNINKYYKLAAVNPARFAQNGSIHRPLPSAETISCRRSQLYNCCRHEKTPLRCRNGVFRLLNLQLTCVSVKLESVNDTNGGESLFAISMLPPIQY